MHNTRCVLYFKADVASMAGVANVASAWFIWTAVNAFRDSLPTFAISL